MTYNPSVVSSPLDGSAKLILIPIGMQGPGFAASRRSAFSSPNSYIGRAPASGAADSALVWTITRITVSPDGTTATAVATNVNWTDYLTHTYQ
jgi:hypothetical protein